MKGWFLDKMEIRRAAEEDVMAIMKIYEYARKFMVENGNPTQWSPAYPNEDVVERDIVNGNCYVCVVNETIVGTFAFIVGEEPTYRAIEHGSWHYDIPYGAIHRLAGSGQVKGVSKACFDFCKSKIDYLRIDTHADNKPMQSVILKNDFKKCGIIHVENGDPRIAFDYLRPSAAETGPSFAAFR